MLNDTKLSLQFWEDAVSTSNYIHNRIPHKGINNKIPYELLTNNKVDYSMALEKQSISLWGFVQGHIEF